MHRAFLAWVFKSFSLANVWFTDFLKSSFFTIIEDKIQLLWLRTLESYIIRVNRDLELEIGGPSTFSSENCLFTYSKLSSSFSLVFGRS